jgi:hypothetical protein
MGLETFSYISSLVQTNPLGSDSKSEGDNHIRGIKQCVYDSFPNIGGEVTATHTNINEAIITAQTAAEVSASATVTNAGYAPGDVRRYGAAIDGVTDDSAAIQAAMDQSAFTGGFPARLGNGTSVIASTLTLKNGTVLLGVTGRQNSKLSYTGAGEAINNGTPGTRIYNVRLEDFDLTDAGTGTIGLHLDSVSQGNFNRLRIVGFGTNYSVTTPAGQSGYAVWNRFYDCFSQSATSYGYDVGGGAAGTSCNENHFIACRSNIDQVGVRITKSNHNVWTLGAVENATGSAISVEDTIGSRTVFNEISKTRFETNNADAININANANATLVMENYIISTGGSVTDNGVRTIWTTPNASPQKGAVNVTTLATNQDVAWLYERTAAGGGTNALMRLYDSNSGSGDPITLEVEAERSTATARLISAKNSSATEIFGVGGNGDLHISDSDITLRVGAGAPSHSANEGSLYIRTDLAGLYINTNGSTAWAVVYLEGL